MRVRAIALYAALALSITGCGQYGVSAPDDLGLAKRLEFDPRVLPVSLDPGERQPEIRRNQIISQWLLRSDNLCQEYQIGLSRAIRDSRLSTDIMATLFSGLATIFVQPAMTRPLAGAAAVSLGIGGDLQSDLFMQQAGDVASTAINTVRARARRTLEEKYTLRYADYTLEQGLLDVQRYDRETCNLNVALNQIRASLNLAGPVVPVANDPIVPPLQKTAEAGTTRPAFSPGTPTATISIPPSVRTMPNGQVVFTPGQVQTVAAETVAPVLRAPPTLIGPSPKGPAGGGGRHTGGGAHTGVGRGTGTVGEHRTVVAPSENIKRVACKGQLPEASIRRREQSLIKSIRELGNTPTNKPTLDRIAEKLNRPDLKRDGAAAEADAIIVFVGSEVCDEPSLSSVTAPLTGLIGF